MFFPTLIACQAKIFPPFSQLIFFFLFNTFCRAYNFWPYTFYNFGIWLICKTGSELLGNLEQHNLLIPIWFFLRLLTVKIRISPPKDKWRIKIHRWLKEKNNLFFLGHLEIKNQNDSNVMKFRKKLTIKEWGLKTKQKKKQFINVDSKPFQWTAKSQFILCFNLNTAFF